MATETKKPIIFSIDDDRQVLRALKSDLRKAFKDDYKIVSTESVQQALATLVEYKKRGDVVAMFVSDQRMPEMEGVDFLEKAKEIYPDSKRVLLTAYSDVEAAIKAINDVQLDYYLTKPWNPPEEKLYPVLKDLLEEWEGTYRPDFQGIKLIGYQYSPKSHEIKDFLAGNLIPYKWYDVEFDAEAKDLLQLHGFENKDLPVLIFEDGTAEAMPIVQEVAPKVGLQPSAKAEMYDVVIIGAGPAGLAASVYGGSEGLKTLLVERRAPGGQAGTSSRIENYLGFPKGLSGSELARRATAQATRFGVEMLSPQSVDHIELEGNYKKITLGNGEIVNAKSVIITTGVDYRKLPAKGAAQFTGAGIYYGAAMTEANGCRNKQVFIVGGGNSAGQGAVYLSKFAKKVSILIRRKDLTATMSSYLIDQIDAIPNIEVVGRRQVLETKGNNRLEELTIENMDDKSQYTENADALFIFIGAKPATDWLTDGILKDDKGYLETGRDLKANSQYTKVWKLDRDPYLLETCQPGIFAAGDVRSGAMNRVASAVGEGAMAIKFVHQYLAEI